MHPGVFINIVGRDHAAERRRRRQAEFAQPDAEPLPAAEEDTRPISGPTWTAWRALRGRSETLPG